MSMVHFSSFVINLMLILYSNNLALVFLTDTALTFKRRTFNMVVA
jgi:hypothetical protein